jgi:hypothetical protein
MILYSKIEKTAIQLKNYLIRKSEEDTWEGEVSNFYIDPETNLILFPNGY